MYDFIFNDNKDGMHCAQVKQATLTVLEGGKTHALLLKTYAYTNAEAQLYKNKAFGYEVSGMVGNTWKLIKTLPETDKEVKFYTLDTKDIEAYTDFKVTAYNASGKSLHPVLFKNSSMAVNIEGPTNIYADVSYQWYAKLWGDDAYTYSWKLKDPVTNQYYPLVQTGPSKSFTTKAPAGKNFILQVFVTDNVSVSGYKEVLVNTTIRPLKANIIGPESIAYKAPIKWEASLDGGLPPYSYIWTTKTEGDFKDIVVGQSDSYATIGKDNFTLKLVVKDAQGNVAFSTKKIAINTTAPINVAITGDKVVYLHKEGLWKMQFTGGEPGFDAIQWFKRKEGQNYPVEPFFYGSLCNNLLEEEGVYYLKSTIKDKNGLIGESPEFKVTAIYQPMYVSIDNNEKILLSQGKEKTWTASIAGGKPDYLYQWKVGKSLDALTLIKEESNSDLNISCNFKAPINDFGKYFIVLSITDGFNKKVTVYQEFTVVKASPFTPPLTITTAPKQNVFSYSPNPVQTSFTVSFNMEKDAFVQLSLIDSKDKSETKLYEQQCTKGRYQKTFTTGLLKSGVYIIQLRWRDDKGLNMAVDKMIIAK
jgi:hypothetical protein